MAFLEKFSADEKEMLVSLPCRAGLWVSNADKSTAPSAEDSEMLALENAIRDQGKGMFDSAFAHEVMTETYARRADWQKWADKLDDVPAVCEQAVAVIAGKLGPRDVDGYRQTVMDIAVAVASAFREFDYEAPLPARLLTYTKVALDRVLGKLTGQEYETNDILNISYDEDVVLAKLAKSLGLDAPSVEDDPEPAKK